ncbi:hypothetical protein GCM10025857_30710 [Alicyclobacillus contaminans]|nr:hypothetical protein GCM10025857_30710 [Alicyclobacillus contaminans]
MVAAAGVLLIILGFLPKIAALTTEIPSSVLGGAMIAMFGMVVASGLNILKMVDLHRQENMLVVACSVAVGLGVAVVPQMFDHLPGALKMLLQSGIVMGSATAVGLNLLLNRSSVRSVTAPDMAMES